MSPSRRARARYDPEAKIARLIGAAAIEIGERGIAGATVPRIAARARVSRGLVHYHFANTAALVHAVARAHCAEWVDVLRTAAAASPDGPALAREVVGAARALVGQHPTFWALRAALVAGAHLDVQLAEILGAAHREGARLIGPLDALVCGFAVRPAAGTLDDPSWAVIEQAAIQLAAGGFA